MGREAAVEKIERLGGVVRSGVSGKTTYLVIGGLLEDGRPVESGSKYRKTTELNEGKRKDNPIEILDEDKFVELVGGGTGGGSEQKEEEAWLPPVEVPVDSASSSSSSSSSSVEKKNTLMWVDKHKPSTLSQVIGNEDIQRNLTQWLSQWDARHIQHQQLPVPRSGGFGGSWMSRGGDISCKAALLSGPPGIGLSAGYMLVE